VCSVSDAVEANEGGANRLEVVRDLELGGLTPSVELVRRIMDAVSLPLRVMVRENNTYETNDEDEMRRLCTAAEAFASLEVDGLVLGFLNRGQVDAEVTARILACAPKTRATFHHAFEGARNQAEALDQIKCLAQVDRILISGGNGSLVGRIERLREYEQLTRPSIKIIAGGGLNGVAIKSIARQTGIKEFHVGRAARSGFRVDGEVQAELVHELVQIATL
jgi:copper homeostasis protein